MYQKPIVLEHYQGLSIIKNDCEEIQDKQRKDCKTAIEYNTKRNIFTESTGVSIQRPHYFTTYIKDSGDTTSIH